jgi:hypothetical protein
MGIFIVGCGFIGTETGDPIKEIPIIPTEEPTKIVPLDIPEVILEAPTPIPTMDPLVTVLESVEFAPLLEALRSGQSISEALDSISPTPTPIPTPSSIEIPTPESILPIPTPTMGPSIIPTATLVPVTVHVPTPTVSPTSTPMPTSTPVISSKYSSVQPVQISGIPDLLDYSEGPVVTDGILSFSSSYAIRGSGTPTVVQVWRRNGAAEAVTSDAKGTDCTSQGPVVFFRSPPTRGMKYSDGEELSYVWTYCINDYKIVSADNVPWKNATTWTHSPSSAPESFVFSGSVAEFSNPATNRFSSMGQWVIVVFSEGRILSEKIIP